MTHRTILLVDDDPDICNVLAMMLDRKEYTVIKSYTSEDAILLLDKHSESIDILITDIRLGDYNGVELYYLACDKCGDELRTIFVTGNDSFEQSEALRHQKNVKIKLKPFSPSELCNDIEKMFD